MGSLDSVTRAAVQRFASGAASLSLLVACGTSDEQAAAGTAATPSTAVALLGTEPAAPSAAEVAAPSTVPSAPTDEESLRAAV